MAEKNSNFSGQDFRGDSPESTSNTTTKNAPAQSRLRNFQVWPHQQYSVFEPNGAIQFDILVHDEESN
jgi:hypothetical protein